ncbi:hypothetical protein OK348_16450 [Flavobacterium sp. MXW15]|uniref:Uncharacterized protein n=1 Tax=Xanthomonas chitinilytica TaxID=2989819 RepID=A0ABT3K020_9XANT|nr:hypothetical protein [Xanthomonas sp. H13-6]MCW4456372.1 hypothetical protein [Flavobacterium sp. MXW15]MCW4474077.1 hypothetical protein [Xanthomonas sp. H13-6]
MTIDAGGPPIRALDRMNEFSCHSMKSGVVDREIWASPGFSSEKYGESDVLHIVCGFHDGEEEPTAGIRFERTGRSQGGSGLARSVSLFADRIRIKLADSRRKTLGFDGSVVELGFRKDQDGASEPGTASWT